jgi:hypothetical protein
MDKFRSDLNTSILSSASPFDLAQEEKYDTNSYFEYANCNRDSRELELEYSAIVKTITRDIVLNNIELTGK